MRLDKDLKKVFNSHMFQRIFQKIMDLGRSPAFRCKRTSRVSPLTREREQFEEDVKGQFQKLKDKGISIPVFTL